MKKYVKFLIVADLHGEVPEILFPEFDAILCPGDICGDDYRYFKSNNSKKINQEIIEKFETDSIDKGIKVLKHLNSFNKPVFLVPGNWDPTKYCDGIKKNSTDKWKNIVSKFKNIIDVENNPHTYKDITFIGHGSVSAPEIISKKDIELEDVRELRRFKYFKKLISIQDKIFSRIEKPIILISHNAPYNSKLDLINSPGSYAHNKHYGSKITRNNILKYSPMVCICGHIHEGKGTEVIGDTLCINAGYGGKINGLLTINIENMEIVSFEFKGKNKS